MLLQDGSTPALQPTLTGPTTTGTPLREHADPEEADGAEPAPEGNPPATKNLLLPVAAYVGLLPML